MITIFITDFHCVLFHIVHFSSTFPFVDFMIAISMARLKATIITSSLSSTSTSAPCQSFRQCVPDSTYPMHEKAISLRSPLNRISSPKQIPFNFRHRCCGEQFCLSVQSGEVTMILKSMWKIWLASSQMIWKLVVLLIARIAIGHRVILITWSEQSIHTAETCYSKQTTPARRVYSVSFPVHLHPSSCWVSRTIHGTPDSQCWPSITELYSTKQVLSAHLIHADGDAYR